jgi:hypothetical protein
MIGLAQALILVAAILIQRVLLGRFVAASRLIYCIGVTTVGTAAMSYVRSARSTGASSRTCNTQSRCGCAPPVSKALN